MPVKCLLNSHPVWPYGKIFNYCWGKSHRVMQDVNRAQTELPSAWKINWARWVSLSVCHKFHILPPEVHLHRASASLAGQEKAKGFTGLFLKHLPVLHRAQMLPVQETNMWCRQSKAARWSTPGVLLHTCAAHSSVALFHFLWRMHIIPLPL